LDKIIPKNNDEGRAIYVNLDNKIDTPSSFLQLCLIMLNQNTHMYIYIEPDQIRRLSYRLQYFFISDSVKVKLYNGNIVHKCYKLPWPTMVI
jgi:hypothetical protein